MKFDLQIDYKHAFVISISTEKMQAIKQLFNQHGLNIQHFDGIKLQQKNIINYTNNCYISNNSELSCVLSHLAIIKYAKLQGLKYVYIFEDDAFPCDGVADKLNTILSKNNFTRGILKLGFISPPDTLCFSLTNNSDFAIVNYSLELHGKTYGAHAYLITNDYYDIVIDSISTTLDIESIFINQLCVNRSLFMQHSLAYLPSMHCSPINCHTIDYQYFTYFKRRLVLDKNVIIKTDNS